MKQKCMKRTCKNVTCRNSLVLNLHDDMIFTLSIFVVVVVVVSYRSKLVLANVCFEFISSNKIGAQTNKPTSSINGMRKLLWNCSIIE